MITDEDIDVLRKQYYSQLPMIAAMTDGADAKECAMAALDLVEAVLEVLQEEGDDVE